MSMIVWVVLGCAYIAAVVFALAVVGGNRRIDEGDE